MRAARVLLAVLALPSIEVGVWALFAPRSFYGSFPGAGRAWVSALGPYNEHLVRDVGAFNLVLAALFLWAAITVDRRLMMASAACSLLFTVPHVIFHAAHLQGLSALDAVGQLVTLGLSVALAVAVVVLTWRAHYAVEDGPVPTH